MPACCDTVCNWAMAAGRYTSVDTASTFFFMRSVSILPSLPVVVVLPAPCRPAIRMMAGGCVARLSPLWAPPINCVSS